MAKETPEQKLLKIMSATQGAASASAVKKPKRSSPFSLKLLNQLLILGIVIAGIVLGMEIRSGQAQLNKKIDISSGSSKAVQQPESAFSLKIQPVSFYLDKISVRNIFRPYEEVKVVGETPVTPSAASKLSKYRLVGVAWLDLPESATAMIEDTSTGTTHFLREGEQLDDVTVKTIYTDRAVLSYENEEITIKL